jgi:hypothetical protein
VLLEISQLLWESQNSQLIHGWHGSNLWEWIEVYSAWLNRSLRMYLLFAFSNYDLSIFECYGVFKAMYWTCLWKMWWILVLEFLNNQMRCEINDKVHYINTYYLLAYLFQYDWKKEVKLLIFVLIILIESLARSFIRRTFFSKGKTRIVCGLGLFWCMLVSI